MNETRFSRRYFFYGTLLAGAGPAGGFGQTSLSALGYKSYNQKLNIAGIGVGTRGPAILQGAAASENIVALCDVDDVRAARGFQEYPKATKYKDYRKLFEKEGKVIEHKKSGGENLEYHHRNLQNAIRKGEALRCDSMLGYYGVVAADIGVESFRRRKYMLWDKTRERLVKS